MPNDVGASEQREVSVPTNIDSHHLNFAVIECLEQCFAVNPKAKSIIYFSAADILTCHGRKCTGVIINNNK